MCVCGVILCPTRTAKNGPLYKDFIFTGSELLSLALVIFIQLDGGQEGGRYGRGGGWVVGGLDFSEEQNDVCGFQSNKHTHIVTHPDIHIHNRMTLLSLHSCPLLLLLSSLL